FKGITATDQQRVIAQVKRSQRLLQVSTNAQTFTALMNTEYDSAHAIVRKGKKHFKNQSGSALGGEDNAEIVYQRAESITSQSLQTYALLSDELYGVKPRAVSGSGFDGNNQSDVDAVVAKYIPNYTDLFGVQDFCECKECRSVLSPAAYMV